MKKAILAGGCALTVIVSCVIPLSADQTITLYPGTTIQDSVDAYPGNSTFLFSAGIYRMQQIEPKTGNTFIGEDSAVLNGSMLCDSSLWQAEGDHWVYPAPQMLEKIHGSCSDDFPGCDRQFSLYINDEFVQRDTSLEALQSGWWYRDPRTARIYIADNPAHKKIELALVQNGIGSEYTTADSVTIQNLIVEKYASNAQDGAVRCGDGNHWRIDGCVFRHNHGAGLLLAGDYHHVQDCRFLFNGQLGFGYEYGTGTVFEDNELAYNNMLGFSAKWEAGATKFVRSDSLIIRNNWAHHNQNGGHGLWCDIDNINVLIEGNVCEHNEGNGIFHEIGYAATIRCNISRFNASDFNSWLFGAQILISTSQNTEIYNNRVETSENHGDAITILQQERGKDYISANNYVHHNHITFHTAHNQEFGDIGLQGGDTDFRKKDFWLNFNNRFDYNAYHTQDTAWHHFVWASAQTDTAMPWNSDDPAHWKEVWGTRCTFAMFQQRGQEHHGTIDTVMTPPHFMDSCGAIAARQIPLQSQGHLPRPSLTAVYNHGQKSIVVYPPLRTPHFSISLVNTAGRILVKKHIHQTPLRLDVSSFSRGLYVVYAHFPENAGHALPIFIP